MNHNLELKLQAWLDGELSGPEALRIGREVEGDADAGRLAAELRAVKSALAGQETDRTVPETREFYWSKIERQIQRQARDPRAALVQPAWRRWFPSLAGFAALGCLMLLAIAYSPSAFDEISSNDGGMEAVTFHDQSAGMTVIWLADDEQPQPTESPAATTPDTDDSGAELE